MTAEYYILQRHVIIQNLLNLSIIVTTYVSKLKGNFQLFGNIKPKQCGEKGIMKPSKTLFQGLRQ